MGWISNCGRSDVDIGGRANQRNTVYFFRDDQGWLNLHFSELTSTRKPGFRLAPALSTGQNSKPPVTPNSTKAVGYRYVTPTLTKPVSVLRKHRWADLPSGPGVYWWYFPENNLDLFRIPEFCQMNRLRLRRSQDDKLCLYHGMATNLAVRIAWHAEQDLTIPALRSGYLSTFRFTLLALNGFNYLAGCQEIDRFMDDLSLSWMEVASPAEAEAIESSELKGEFHCPLNIRENHRVELDLYISFLKSIRKAYKRCYL
jgi:hypothetical protein